MLLTDTKAIICNAGAFNLQSRSISAITVQTPTELNTPHTYALSASDDLPLGLIALATDHTINHKHLMFLSIPRLNTVNDRVYIPQETVLSTLNPIEN